MILTTCLTTLLAVGTSEPQWEGWNLVQICHDVALEYRLSADPWGERVELELENRGDEKVAAAADTSLRWNDGETSDHVTIVLGGVGGPVAASDSSVLEAWAAPRRVATREWDRSAGSPHPVTGLRPTIATIVVHRIWVTTESYWKKWIAAHPGAPYSLRDGPSCDGREIPVAWRRIARTWAGEDGAKNSFEQRVELCDGSLESCSVVRLHGEPDEFVRAKLEPDSIESVRVAQATPYEMAFGKVVFVEVRLRGTGVAVVSKGEESDESDRLLLHFYVLSDAQACVDAIDKWRKKGRSAGSRPTRGRLHRPSLRSRAAMRWRSHVPLASEPMSRRLAAGRPRPRGRR